MPLDAPFTVDEALLAGIADFARQSLARHWPALPIRPQATDFARLTAAAEEAGLLDAECGLWHELANGDAPAFTLQALVTLAETAPAAAWHLHALALGRAAARVAGLADTPATAFCLDGSHGIGRSALGRWLASRTAAADDGTLLAGTWGDAPRHALLAPGTTQAITPCWRDGGFHAIRFAIDDAHAGSDEQPMGMDGCRALRLTPGPATASAPLTRGAFASLVAAQQLAQVAIALGAATPAARLARDYAAIRQQGARLIVMHDSVAQLLADADSALATVQSLLRQAGVTRSDVPAALVLRREAMPLLCRAVNQAMQVHGGIGYMRDTGVEDRLRAVNTMRVLGGSPAELTLVIAGMELANAALPEVIDAGAAHLPGHLAAGHPLSPWTALRRVPLLRAVSAYAPRDPWEVDTDRLPAPLAALRRRVRAFAAREIAPLAAYIDVEQAGAHASTPALRSVLTRAARAGLLTDLLPAPLGSAPWRQYAHSLAWQQAIRAEELARADGGLMLLVSAHNLGLCPLLLSGDLRILREVVLPAFRSTAAGDPQVFAFAITEPAAGSDAEDGHGALAQKAGVTARRTTGGWLLNGRKVFISGGDIARHVAVFAALEGEGYASWTCFVVDSRSAGYRVARTEHKMGMRASGAAELEFSDCFVPDARVAGGLRNGWALARATLNLSRLPVAAMAVGFAQQAVDIATAFACETRLAGRPLLHFQQVQATLADLQAETSAIRALVWHHARNWTPRQDGAALCKFHATDRAQVVIETAMDLLGSAAIRHDQQIERTFRDNRLTRIFEGTNQINRLAVIEDQQASLLARIAAATPGNTP